MDYTIEYCNRKTVSIRVRDGEIIVRSPRGLSKAVIDELVNKHKSWIQKRLKNDAAKTERESELNEEKIKELKLSAKEYFVEETARYAEIMGLKYCKVKITSAKRRFGSCNTKGIICFSYRLMLYPKEAREYVIVHELAHLVHMNHSKDFYAIVEKYMPDFKKRKKLLKM